MSAILLNGSELKSKKMEGFKKRVEILKNKGINPHLVVIQVGNNPVSNIYIGHKERTCKTLGMKFTKVHLENDISYEDMAKEVEKLNKDESVHGMIIQLPLPKQFNGKLIDTLIDPKKDADGVHPYNQGINFTRQNEFAPIPCTAHGIMEFFKEYKINLEGKEVVIMGRSNIVGRPCSYLFANANAIVTMLHSKTKPETLKRKMASADVIVLATGQKDLITPEMVKQGVIIIDVGMIRTAEGKLRGDILYREFMNKASYITPVPRGVGPMTVTMLIDNVLKLAESKNK